MKGVTAKQARQIKKHMKHINEAKRSDYWGEEEIIRRTKILHQYLEEEGIVQPPVEYYDE